MKIISVITSKGGTGKTTVSGALAAGLKKRGYRILAVDMDPQCNLTASFGLSMDSLTDKNIFRVMNKQIDLKDAIVPCDTADLIPASPSLAVADITFVSVGKEYILAKALKKAQLHYDYVILDNPPSLGILTVNSLTASDEVIIPSQADKFSLQGIHGLNQTIEAVKEYTNPHLRILGIVLNRYNARTVISRNVADMLDVSSKGMDTTLFKTKIRECTAIKEAQLVGQSIFDYAPSSNAANDFNSLIDEVLLMEEGN